MRGLHEPPLIESLQILDIGFSSYSIFCITSVISTLAISLPPLPVGMVDEDKDDRTSPATDEDDKTSPATAAVCHQGSLQQPGRFVLGSASLMATVACLTAAWAGLFVVGIFAPSLGLRLNIDAILDRQSSIPSMIKPLIKSVLNKHNIDADVSIWRATWTLWTWFWTDGELNLLLAFVLFAGFVVALTALDMAALFAATLCFRWQTGGKPDRPCLPMRAAELMKHLAMLDVCVVGIICTSLAGAMYKAQGIILKLMWGIPVLIASEVLHYVTFYLVSSTWEANITTVEGKEAI